MENVTIRFVKEKDMDALIQLCKLHAIYEKSDYDVRNKKEFLQRHLFSKNPPLFCIVAEYKNTLIGYAAYTKQFSTWDASFYVYMDCLFLTEESRGFGIGKQLINVIKKESKKLGCTFMQWQTPDFNTRAIKFYNRMGATSTTKERYFLPL